MCLNSDLVAAEGSPCIQIFNGNSTIEKKNFSLAGKFTGAVRHNEMERKHLEIVSNSYNRKQNDVQIIVLGNKTDRQLQPYSSQHCENVSFVHQHDIFFRSLLKVKRYVYNQVLTFTRILILSPVAIQIGTV